MNFESNFIQNSLNLLELHSHVTELTDKSLKHLQRCVNGMPGQVAASTGPDLHELLARGEQTSRIQRTVTTTPSRVLSKTGIRTPWPGVYSSRSCFADVTRARDLGAKV